jgi:hypothetical protein
MNEVIYQKSYQDLKQELDTELHKTAEGFVRIGYLLKVARDTSILEESPYKTVTEFAEAEYGLNSTYVSRFISINDRFSQDGYSDCLDSKYQGYGYAKLTVMLQLPDSMAEELSPEMSKKEIEAIKEEFDEEKKVSDIERVIEGNNPLAHNLDDVDERLELLYQTVLALGEDEPELYIKVAAVDADNQLTELPRIMVPSDVKVYSIRVIGKGRMMLTIKEGSEDISIVNSRSGEKETYSWSEIAAAWEYAGVLQQGKTPIEKWEARYEKKWEIAPVQQATEDASEPKKETPKKKESKVTKAKPDKKEPQKEAEPTKEAIEDEQIEGQMNFEEACPEIIPGATENDCSSQIQPEMIASQEDGDESQELEEVSQRRSSIVDMSTIGATLAKFPEAVEIERKEVIELLDGLRAEVCKDNITSNSIRELKDNTGYLVTKALANLAEALWDYEAELPDDDEDEE